MATDTNTDFSLDLDEDFNIDDIPDLPTPFPTGVYKFAFDEGFREATINDKPWALLDMRCIEVVEIPDDSLEESEVAPKEGSTCTLMWNMGSKLGAGQWKLLALPIARQAGVKNKDGIFEASRATEMQIALIRTEDKNDPDKKYNRVKKAIIL